MFQAIAKSSKDLSDNGASARVVATINNGHETIYNSVLKTTKIDGKDVVVSRFVVPTHANCLKIVVSNNSIVQKYLLLQHVLLYSCIQ